MGRGRLKIIDGQRFGSQVVVTHDIKMMGPHYASLVRCDCGSERIVVNYALVRGDSKSCQNCANGSRYDEAVADIGKTFGERTILSVMNCGLGNFVEVQCKCGSVNSVRYGAFKKGVGVECEKCSGVTRSLKYAAINRKLRDIARDLLMMGYTRHEIREMWSIGTDALSRLTVGLGYHAPRKHKYQHDKA